MNNLPKFTLRISPELHKKIKYMATFNGRSKNREIEVAINRYIRDFENLHGIIEIESEIDE